MILVAADDEIVGFVVFWPGDVARHRLRMALYVIHEGLRCGAVVCKGERGRLVEAAGGEVAAAVFVLEEVGRVVLSAVRHKDEEELVRVHADGKATLVVAIVLDEAHDPTVLTTPRRREDLDACHDAERLRREPREVGAALVRTDQAFVRGAARKFEPAVGVLRDARRRRCSTPAMRRLACIARHTRHGQLTVLALPTLRVVVVGILPDRRELI